NFDIEIDYGKTRDDPYSRRFDEYREEFDNEIEQLANEYNLRIGKKGYDLDDVWEKCENIMTVQYIHGMMKDLRKKSNGKVLDDALPSVRAKGSRLIGMIRKEMNEDGDSHNKEMEFEVTSTRTHVVKMFLLGRNYFSYTVTDIATA
ncbi:hypothetical protein Tco_1398733, partial [Tanacetum coccineum]